MAYALKAIQVALTGGIDQVSSSASPKKVIAISNQGTHAAYLGDSAASSSNGFLLPPASIVHISDASDQKSCDIDLSLVYVTGTSTEKVSFLVLDRG